MKRRILVALACVILLPILAIGALFAMRETPTALASRRRQEWSESRPAGPTHGSYARRTGRVLVDAGLDAQGCRNPCRVGGTARGSRKDPGRPHHARAPGPLCCGGDSSQRATIVAGSQDVAMIRGDRTHYSTFGRIIGSVMPLPAAPRAITPVRGGERLECEARGSPSSRTPGDSREASCTSTRTCSSPATR